MRTMSIAIGATFGLVLCIFLGIVPPPIIPPNMSQILAGEGKPVFYIISAKEFPSLNGEKRILLEYSANGITCIADFPDGKHMDHFIKHLAEQGEIQAYSDRILRDGGSNGVPGVPGGSMEIGGER